MTKLPNVKAKLLIAFFGKYLPKAASGDTALIGTFIHMGVNSIGIAIFKADCLVYLESATASDWAIVKPIIFGPET